MEPRLHRGLGQTPTCLRPSPRVHGSPLLCGSLWLWDVENGPPLLSSAQVPAFPSGQQECCVCVSVCVCVCVCRRGKLPAVQVRRPQVGPGGRAAVRPSGCRRQLWVPSTHQTLTVLSPSSLGAPPPPQADGSIFAPLRGGRLQLEGASLRGRSRKGRVGSHEVWEPRRQFWAAPYVRCGSGLLNRAARTGRRSGVCSGLRFCSGPGWAGAWEPLRGPPSPGSHQRVTWGPYTLF